MAGLHLKRETLGEVSLVNVVVESVVVVVVVVVSSSPTLAARRLLIWESCKCLCPIELRDEFRRDVGYIQLPKQYI